MTASNTGSQTYNDVNLVGQFVWNNNNPANEVPLNYTAYNTWANGTPDNFSISSYAICAGPSTAPVLFPWTDADTPLTWTRTGNPATVSSSDSFPAIPLGDFGPGATENFSLNCPSDYFDPDAVGFFVAVPEPSTFVLLMVGGAGLLGYLWRRRGAKA